MMERFNEGEGIAIDPARLTPALGHLLDDAELGRVWLLEETTSDDVVGYAVLTLGYDLEVAGPDSFLTELYVVPSARQAGVGREALALIEEEASALGVRAIHLMVRPENAPARALYQTSRLHKSPPRLFLSELL